MSACPDLRPCFKHYRWAPMPHSYGVPVGCDWNDPVLPPGVPDNYRQNGSWTMAEVSILFDIAKQIGGHWLDIGGSTGWTAAHLAKAGCDVDSLDPMYALPAFEDRAIENLLAVGVYDKVVLWPVTSGVFFQTLDGLSLYDGIVIDGCHEPPVPLEDAQNALVHLKMRGAILFHDAVGAPVQDGAQYLVNAGLEGSAYPTCHGVAVCWRGDLALPAGPQEGRA